MTSKECEKRLSEAGIKFQINRLPNDYGDQFRLDNGVIINVFDTGKYNVQGRIYKNKMQISRCLENKGRFFKKKVDLNLNKKDSPF